MLTLIEDGKFKRKLLERLFFGGESLGIVCVE